MRSENDKIKKYLHCKQMETCFRMIVVLIASSVMDKMIEFRFLQIWRIRQNNDIRMRRRKEESLKECQVK